MSAFTNGNLIFEAIWNQKNELSMSHAAISVSLEDDFSMLEESRKGLTRDAFLQISKDFPFLESEWKSLVGMEKSAEQVRFFNGPTAERILLVARVASRGVSVFGSFKLFRQWLDTPIPALQGKAPITFLNNSFGLQILQDELGRIEHGLFA